MSTFKKTFEQPIDERLGLSIVLEGAFEIIGTPVYSPKYFQFKSQEDKTVVIKIRKNQHTEVLAYYKWQSFLNFAQDSHSKKQGLKIAADNLHGDTKETRLFDKLSDNLSGVAKEISKAVEQCQYLVKITDAITVKYYCVPILKTGECIQFYETRRDEDPYLSDYLNNYFKLTSKKEDTESIPKPKIVLGTLNTGDGSYYSEDGIELNSFYYLPLERLGNETVEFLSLEETFAL